MKNSRRQFLHQSSQMAVAGALLPGQLLANPSQPQIRSAADTISVALIGCNSMGWVTLMSMLRHPGVRCVALCDVDQNVLTKRAGELAKLPGMLPDAPKPVLYNDFRKLLENKNIDAVIIGTPDHWHCLPMVMACQAGKDVYVEKPLANSIEECNLMVAAAKKHQRIVQVGQWQRSGGHWKAAIDLVQSGKIGTVRTVKTYMPHGKTFPVLPDEPIPVGVDYEMWLGPAPQRPFNKIMPSLPHNTLRAMYFGAMTQPMADAFIRENLLDPAAFWTPMPLPSTAVGDPFFRNISNNNWSGQPQGLTYQRAIGALEKYGHRAEVTLIGARLLRKVAQTGRFTQQFDPFTADQNGSDGYGPTILATLEYYSRLFGVYAQNDTLHFSGLAAHKPYSYTQKLKDKHYKLVQNKGRLTGYLNGRELFSSTAGIDVMTNPAGKILGLAGIDTVTRKVQLKTGGKSYHTTNGHYRLTTNQIQLLRKVSFDFPYRNPDTVKN